MKDWGRRKKKRFLLSLDACSKVLFSIQGKNIFKGDRFRIQGLKEKFGWEKKKNKGLLKGEKEAAGAVFICSLTF